MQPGSYTIRVKVPRGVKLMPHKHPEDRVYTVISGVFYIGLGDEFDDGKLEAYPPGTVIYSAREYIAFSLGKIRRVHHTGISHGSTWPRVRAIEDDPRNQSSDLQS